MECVTRWHLQQSEQVLSHSNESKQVSLKLLQLDAMGSTTMRAMVSPILYFLRGAFNSFVGSSWAFLGP